MKNTAVILLIIVLILSITAYWIGGMELVSKSLDKAGQTALHSILLIIFAFLVIGQLQVVISADVVKKLLDKYSGTKGIILSALAGGLFPGGPYIFYPFLAGLKGKGIPYYLILSFTAGKHGYDFTRLPLEISLISPGLALLRNIITLPVPYLLGLVSRRIIKSNHDFPADNRGELR